MNNRFSEARYDERQTAVRGRAFKWAYGTLLVTLVICSVTDGIWNWCVPFTGCAIAIAASLYPFLWVCVFGEAYWWTDVSRTGQYVTMALLGLMNLGLGLADAARGRARRGGRAADGRCEPRARQRVHIPLCDCHGAAPEALSGR